LADFNILLKVGADIHIFSAQALLDNKSRLANFIACSSSIFKSTLSRHSLGIHKGAKQHTFKFLLIILSLHGLAIKLN
jgi:hypothetical protein